MIFALSTGHEIGLASVGAAFILFALLSSFVFPRKWPDFPGRKGMRWYIPLSICFFLAMMSAVLVFGRSKPAAASASSTTSTTSSQYAGGNAAAGAAVFTSAGCAACHTLAAAKSHGTIGPNLDDIASYAQKAGEPLDTFIGDAITHPPAAYVPPGFGNTMPTTFGSSLSSTELANLVAFIAGSH